jgi:hypothetical protein
LTLRVYRSFPCHQSYTVKWSSPIGSLLLHRIVCASLLFSSWSSIGLSPSLSLSRCGGWRRSLPSGRQRHIHERRSDLAWTRSPLPPAVAAAPFPPTTARLRAPVGPISLRWPSPTPPLSPTSSQVQAPPLPQHGVVAPMPCEEAGALAGGWV